MKFDIHKKAKKSLRIYEKKDRKLFLHLFRALNELREKELESSNIKSLEGLPNGYRKRVGRYRIVFTAEYINNVLKVWVIDIEKDTQKDYKRWISFIKSQL